MYDSDDFNGVCYFNIWYSTGFKKETSHRRRHPPPPPPPPKLGCSFPLRVHVYIK